MKQIFQTCWPNTLTFINCHWYKVMTCGLFIINQCDANFLYLYIICYGLQACCGPQTCFKLYIFYHWPWRGQMTLIHVTHCLVIRYLISLYIVVVNQTHIFNFSDITNFELGHISFGLMQDWIQGVGWGGGGVMVGGGCAEDICYSMDFYYPSITKLWLMILKDNSRFFF